MACGECAKRRAMAAAKANNTNQTVVRTTAPKNTESQGKCLGMISALHLLNVKCIRSYNKARLGDAEDKETAALILAISREVSVWIRNIRNDCPPEDTLSEYTAVVELAYIKYIEPSKNVENENEKEVRGSSEEVINTTES